MNLELLNERLEELKKELLNNEQAMDQLVANANAIHGAIQEVNHWIESFKNEVM